MKKDNPNKPFVLWVGYKGGVSIIAPKVTLIYFDLDVQIHVIGERHKTFIWQQCW
jgi:hypothetical protein